MIRVIIKIKYLLKPILTYTAMKMLNNTKNEILLSLYIQILILFVFPVHSA